MRNWRISSKEIVDNINGKIKGKKEVIIDDCCSLSNARNNCLMFATSLKWRPEYLEKIKPLQDLFVIIDADIEGVFGEVEEKNTIFVVDNARLSFAKSLKIILNHNLSTRSYSALENNVILGENVTIGKNCTIEPFVFIDHDCIIGDNVTIKTGAKLRQNVKLCNNVVVGENSVIGAQGFGIETDYDGKKIRIPHIGGVVVGKDTEIGALTSIVSGTMEPTIIGENCFIDDLNHIAHNCVIGSGTLTAGCTEFGGSFKVGENGYFAPNSTMRNGITLGDNCFVGQAASVQKSFEDNVSLVGSPARTFDKKNK